MIDLPEEIWRKITGFLKKKYLTPLLGVNHMLRGISLDRMYEWVSIDLGRLGQREYLHQIGHLGHLRYATRIQKLSISSRNVAKPSPKPPTRRNLRSTLDTVSGLHNRLRGRKLSKAETAQQLMVSFVNLKELEMSCAGEEEQMGFETQMPLLLSSFQAYTTTLTSIRFSNSSLSFLSTFLPRLPTFISLEQLFLKVTDHSPGDRPNEFELLLRDAVAPFISRHCTTLSSLRIPIEPFSKNYDFLTLFQKMNFIPRLKTLEIPLTVGQLSSSQSLQRILGRHSETLDDLKLHVPFDERTLSAGEASFTTILSPLPRLKQLAIRCVYVNAFHVADFPSTGFMNYVSKYSTHLSTFEVSMKFFAPDDWMEFVGMEWNSLTSLSLGFKIITPAVFDGFSKSFPSLKSLSLLVSAFQETFEAQGSTKKFCAEMTSRMYPKTSLTYLKMSRQRHPYTEMQSPHMSCLGAIVKAFPSVVLVNEFSRATFLQDLAAAQLRAGQGQWIPDAYSSPDDSSYLI